MKTNNILTIHINKKYTFLVVSSAPIEANPLDEEEEEEVMLEDANMEAVSQIALKGAEEELKMKEADASPGPSGLAETQPPDEEQAGLEWFFSDYLQS